MKNKYKFLGLIPLALVPVPFVVSCTSKTEEKVLSSDDNLVLIKQKLSSDVILSKKAYNTLYDKVEAAGHDFVGLAIIANHKIYDQVIPGIKGEKVGDVLAKSNFEFNYHDTAGLGKFLNTFRPKGTDEGLHGTREEKNYGDYYPIYYINHTYAEFGVSNGTTSFHEIYEITYDDK